MVPGGNDEDKEKPAVDMTRTLKGAIKNAERLGERRRKDQEEIEELCWILYKFENLLQQRAHLDPPPAATPKGPAPTVEDLRMEEVGQGRAVVTFDNAKRVNLSPTLKALIAILAADEGVSPDALVAWKSFERLAELLEKRLDRKFSDHALSQLLWRLRESLGAAGLDRDLVESRPGLGARLRLKRGSPAALCAG